LALEDVQERDAGEQNDGAALPAREEVPGGTGGGPPYRLRDLRGRDLALVLATLALVIVPFVVALVRSWHDGWLPSGDEANIATRSLDVFSRHPPLTGLPSTSFRYGKDIYTYHPGPFEFYLIAVPIRLFGMRAGPLFTAAGINLSAVLIALWVLYRRAGIAVMLWAGVLIQLVIWSAGTSVLVDTLSSNMPMYSVLCTAVLCWALIEGDYRLLPLTALVASYAAQQHLAATSLVGVIVLFALAFLVVTVIVRTRRGEVGLVRASLRFALIAFGVAFVCWLPPIVNQIVGHPGNITEIIRFALDNNRPKVGIRSGVTQAVRAIAPPTVLGHTNWTGLEVSQHLDTARRVAGVVVVLLLLGAGVVGWRKRRALRNLVVLTVVFLAAGVVNGGNIPFSDEAWRINLYRWTWTAAFLTWTAIGWGLALVAAPLFARLRDAQPRVHRLAPIALVVVAALVASATVLTSSADDHNRERPAFALEPAIGAAVLRNVDHKHPVLVSFSGAAAADIGCYIVFRLVRAGVPVEVTPFFLPDYGGHRKYHPAPNTPALVVSSRKTAFGSTPGRTIADTVFDPEYTALVDDLVASSAGQKLELAPGGQQIIARDFPEPKLRALMELLLLSYPSNPRGVIANGFFLRLIEEGAVKTPYLDPAKVHRLRELADNPNKIIGDERLRISVVPPDQINSSTVPGLS
jgi:hypothetical protein